MGEECIISGEFAGELPQAMAAILGPAVGHGSACMLYEQSQEADRHLGRLPRFLWLDGHRVTISRPAGQRQWSTLPGLAQPAPAARRARAPVTATAAASPVMAAQMAHTQARTCTATGQAMQIWLSVASVPGQLACGQSCAAAVP